MATNPHLNALKSREKKRGSVFNNIKEQLLSSSGASKRATMLPSSSSPINFPERKEHLSECGFERRVATLPPIVEQTCIYLEQHALQIEGLFRIPGSSEDIKKIKEKFDKGKKPNLKKELNPHTVAGVLKLFFTELPNPILTYELYPSFMAASEIKDINLRLACIRKVFDRLPIGNREVVKRVTAMFHIISSFNEENKMTSRNIALVMNANMFRGRDQSIHNFMQTGGMRCRLIEHMIDNHNELFIEPKEILENYLKQETTMEVKLQIDRFFDILRNDSIVLASSLVEEGEKFLSISFDEVNITTIQSSSQLLLETDENHNNANNNNNNNNSDLSDAEKISSLPVQITKNRRRQGIKINVNDIKAALQSESLSDPIFSAHDEDGDGGDNKIMNDEGDSDMLLTPKDTHLDISPAEENDQHIKHEVEDDNNSNNNNNNSNSNDSSNDSNSNNNNNNSSSKSKDGSIEKDNDKKKSKHRKTKPSKSKLIPSHDVDDNKSNANNNDNDDDQTDNNTTSINDTKSTPRKRTSKSDDKSNCNDEKENTKNGSGKRTSGGSRSNHNSQKEDNNNENEDGNNSNNTATTKKDNENDINSLKESSEDIKSKDEPSADDPIAIAKAYQLNLDDLVEQLLTGDADRVYMIIDSLEFKYRATMFEHLKHMIALLVPTS